MTYIITTPMRIRLTVHANMLGMLYLPPGMPHDGLTPTGAVEVGIESPLSELLGDKRSSYNMVRFPLNPNNPIGGYIPDCKKDCTKDN